MNKYVFFKACLWFCARISGIMQNSSQIIFFISIYMLTHLTCSLTNTKTLTEHKIHTAVSKQYYAGHVAQIIGNAFTVCINNQ